MKEHSTELRRIATGIAGLDQILQGGWPPSHLYLVEGTAGAGKTTLALQFLLEGVRNNEKVLYVTLAESKAELDEVAASHGINLDGIEIHEHCPTEDSLRKENEYSALYPGEVEFQDTVQTILDKVDKVRPSRLVLDSLSEIRVLAQDPLRYRRQVLALKHFFLNRNTTVLMLDGPAANSEESQLQSIAHGVLLLERLPRDYGVERRRLRVSKLRGSSFSEGFHDYIIKRGGMQVFPRLVAGAHRDQCHPGVMKSGVAELDALTGGGIPVGTATMFKGPAGCGKSTISTKYAHHAATTGIRSAIFQFDETLATTLMRSQALGMDLEPLIASGMLELQQFDPAELSPGEFISHVRDVVEKQDVRLVIIDTINGFLNAMAGEQRLLLQMHELCIFLNQCGVCTFLVLSQSGVFHPRSPEGADLSYLADNAFLFSYFEAFGKVKKAISVLKMRTGWHEASIRELRFSRNQFSVGEPLCDFQGILSGAPTYTGSPAILDRAMRDQSEPK